MAELNGLLSGLFSDPESAAKLARIMGALGSGTEHAPRPGEKERPDGDREPSSDPGPTPLPPALDSAALLFKALPILNEFSEGDRDPKVQLLYALRPYLTGERLERLEDAVLLLKLARIAGSVLELFDGR